MRYTIETLYPISSRIFKRKNGYYVTIIIDEPFCPVQKQCGCYLCHKDIKDEMFMVHDDLWLDTIDNNKLLEIICISCFEQKLGRKLVIEDLTDAPINNTLKFNMLAKY